jgi:hypothetical protein
MNSPSYSFISRQSKSPLQLSGIDIAFVGSSVDDRGSATIEMLKDSLITVSKLRYIPDEQKIYLDNRLSKRDCLVAHMTSAKRILIDATTLGLGEILNILLAVRSGKHSEVEFLYAEPSDYTKNMSNSNKEFPDSDFALTTNCRFQGILGFAHEYQSKNMAAHVFLLGYEPARIRNAIEQRGDFDRKHYTIHVVLGVPAFQSGWESNTIRTHLGVLEGLEIGVNSITYCQANSIRESYLTLWDLYS